jgi:phage protein D
MGDLGTSQGFYSARPTIILDGQINTELGGGLLTLLVEETTAGLYRCEATFSNWGSTGGGVGFLYLDRRLLDFGKRLTIRMGKGKAEAQVFEGRIMGLEARYPKMRPPEISVLAEDRFQELRMTRRTRTFENIDDRQVMEQVASEQGLQASVDVDGPTYQVLAQVNQSDLAFLRERARAIDAEVWLEDGTLHGQKRNRRNAGKVTLTYGQGLKEFSVLADLAHQRTSLVVSGWDVDSKSGLFFEADETALGGELQGRGSGSKVLLNALGKRVERLVHLVPQDAKEAQVLAEARYRAMARRFITGSGLAEGDGRIQVGAKLELKGLGDLFDGDYYATETRHTFDWKHGYRTQFYVERPGL